MKYICPRCGYRDKSTVRLWAHIKMKHGATLYGPWHCKQSNCSRTFCDVYSFKKHLNSKHSPDSDPTPAVQLSENAEVNRVDHILPGYSIHNDGSELTEQFVEEPEISIPTLDEFKNALLESSSGFLSKLNSHPNITKATVQDIVNYTSDLFKPILVEPPRVLGFYRHFEESP